jgi:hypothetical protein
MLYGFYGGAWQLWLGTRTNGYNKIVGSPVQLGAWTYLAATFDGAVARFFVNGFQVGSSNSLFAVNQGAVLRLGGGATDSFPGSYFFQGNLDEVAVYNRALSPGSILAHYSVGLGLWVSLQRTFNTTLLSWSGGTLQQASLITGPWTNLSATSPLDLGPAPPGMMFYRVRH